MMPKHTYPSALGRLGPLPVLLAIACSSSCSHGGGSGGAFDASSGAGGTTAASGGASGNGGAATAGGAQGLGGSLGSGGRAAGGTAGRADASADAAGSGGTATGGRPTMDGAAGASGGRAGATSVGGRGGTGGPSSGGSTGNGGAATDGGTNKPSPSYWIGADITWVQADEARGATYSDGSKRDILQILKDHGFNAIRLRTFVDPKASDGYDRSGGYGDLAHTITFGKRIKAAGMRFLLDFHYSDNWADPGKQCVPVAWQKYTTITDLATAVHDYTQDAITQLIAADARPDMVQVGNEITPGMLLHVCDSGGKPTGSNQITGSTSNWANLGTLLKAGIKGVKDVDTDILIMLHIDKGGDKPSESAGAALSTSKSWINNAIKQGVSFDVFGESCYQKYQGDIDSTTTTKTGWTNTFTGLASAFPDLQFVAAEYGPMQREINDVLYGLAAKRGLGTFNWEPTHEGDWNTGHVLFSASGNAYTATADLSLYDSMKAAYADRLQ